MFQVLQLCDEVLEGLINRLRSSNWEFKVLQTGVCCGVGSISTTYNPRPLFYWLLRSRVSRVADGLIFGFGRYSTNKARCPAGALLGGQSAVGFMCSLLLASSSRSPTEPEDETARDTRGVTEQSRTARRAIKPLYHGPITIGI